MSEILIIEDSAEIGGLISELLEIDGYSVELITDASLVTSYLENKLPDLIICDVVMPSMSGYQILQLLKSEELFKNIPLIFLSAKAEEEDIARGLSSGAEAYLTKPYKSRDLLLKVREIIGNKTR